MSPVDVSESCVPIPSPYVPLDDPSLHELQAIENPHADSYKRLQRGLCMDAEGAVRIRPDLESKISAPTLDMGIQLLVQGMNSAANAIVACQNLYKTHQECPQGHERHATVIRCGYEFFCRTCSSPKMRVSKFRHEHPYLHNHLMTSTFQVVSVIFPEMDRCVKRADYEQARIVLHQLMDLHPGGWFEALAFHFDEESSCLFPAVKYNFIYQGPKLPAWPQLNAEWKRIAGAGGVIKVRTFDGRDGDTQDKGLQLAFDGMEGYWDTIEDENADSASAIDVADDFAKFSKYMAYGDFRGFEARAEAEGRALHQEPESTDICGADGDHELSVCCSTCLSDLVATPNAPLCTIEELSANGARIIFSHRSKAIYGRKYPQGLARPLNSVKKGHAPPS